MYNLLVSKNGTQAIDLAREHNPDLILLDILMPDMTGFEVIAKLKESSDTNKIPVIFITGLTSIEDEEKGFFLGAVDYITKPFHKSIVKARVNTHLKIVDQMRIIEQMGLIDPLTKLFNRRGLEDQLNIEWGRALREKLSISILLMDIDFFKKYNDTYGHQKGDTALKAFAEIVAKTLKRPTDLAARWGGEEFVVLLQATTIDGATEVAENIRKNVEAAIIPAEDGIETKITVSIGINTIIPNESSSIKEFIEKADKALYKAKELGRNRSVINTDS
jgi:diguanylate cyclase (GGDEF)-like protein